MAVGMVPDKVAGATSDNNQRQDQRSRVVAQGQVVDAQDVFRSQVPANTENNAVPRSEDQSEQVLAIEELAQQVNNLIKDIETSLRFVVNEDLGRVVIEVMDVENDEVIRSIPPEDLIEIATRLKQVIEEINSVGGVIEPEKSGLIINTIV